MKFDDIFEEIKESIIAKEHLMINGIAMRKGTKLSGDLLYFGHDLNKLRQQSFAAIKENEIVKIKM